MQMDSNGRAGECPGIELGRGSGLFGCGFLTGHTSSRGGAKSDFIIADRLVPFVAGRFPEASRVSGRRMSVYTHSADALVNQILPLAAKRLSLRGRRPRWPWRHAIHGDWLHQLRASAIRIK